MNVSLTLLVCQEVLLLDADNSIEHILVVPLGSGEEGGEEGREKCEVWYSCDCTRVTHLPWLKCQSSLCRALSPREAVRCKSHDKPQDNHMTTRWYLVP